MKNKDTLHVAGGIAVKEAHQISKQIKKECLRLLTRRDHSRKEIQGKLTIKGYEPDQVAVVVDELAQQSWQDDTRYAQSYARIRSQKGFGPVRIAYELQQQGIEPAKVDSVLRATTDDWMNLLVQAYDKKYSYSAIMDGCEQAKRSRFLLQRGYSSHMIQDFFKQTTTKST
jgi:regulatory protein